MRIPSLLLLAAFCCCAGSSMSQAPEIAYSEHFTPAYLTSSRIVQLPNGNTFLFSTTFLNKGFEVRMWDAAHRFITARNFEGSSISYNSSVIILDNEVLYFHQETGAKNMSVLHEYRFSGKNGQLISDTVRHPMPYDINGLSSNENKVTVEAIAIRDKWTNAYAVGVSNFFAKEGPLRFHHYNSNRELQYSQSFGTPDEKFPDPMLLDMIVEGDTAITALTACFEKGKKSRSADKSFIYLSRITAAGVSHHRMMPFTGVIVKGMMASDREHTGYGIVLRNGASEHGSSEKTLKHVLMVSRDYATVQVNTPFHAPPVPDKYRLGMQFKRMFKANVNEPREVIFSKDSGLTVYYETMDIVGDYFLKGVGSIHYRTDGTVVPGPAAFKAQATQTEFHFDQHLWANGQDKALVIKGLNVRYEDDSRAGSFVLCKGLKDTRIVFNARPQIMIDNPEIPLVITKGNNRAMDIGVYMQTLGSAENAVNVFNVPANGNGSKQIFAYASHYDPVTSTLAVQLEEEMDNKWRIRIAWIKI